MKRRAVELTIRQIYRYVDLVNGRADQLERRIELLENPRPMTGQQRAAITRRRDPNTGRFAPKR